MCVYTSTIYARTVRERMVRRLRPGWRRRRRRRGSVYMRTMSTRWRSETAPATVADSLTPVLAISFSILVTSLTAARTSTASTASGITSTSDDACAAAPPDSHPTRRINDNRLSIRDRSTTYVQGIWCILIQARGQSDKI